MSKRKYAPIQMLFPINKEKLASGMAQKARKEKRGLTGDCSSITLFRVGVPPVMGARPWAKTLLHLV